MGSVRSGSRFRKKLWAFFRGKKAHFSLYTVLENVNIQEIIRTNQKLSLGLVCTKCEEWEVWHLKI
jgi:hypothetical protein